MKVDWYKIGLLALCLGLTAIACNRNSKLTEENTTEVTMEEKVPEGFSKGIIVTDFADEGCKALIRLAKSDGSELLLPLTIDEKYVVNGKVVFIKFRPSRAPNPSDCQKGLLVSLDEIRD